MQSLDQSGRMINDKWVLSDKVDLRSGDQWAVFPLSILQNMESFPERTTQIGVWAPAGTLLDDLVPYLGSLSIIMIEFPKFRDGRGFTLARNLRAQAHYDREIRAVGHLLPDQFRALIQCGFTSVELSKEHPQEQWIKILTKGSKASTGPLLQRLLKR